MDPMATRNVPAASRDSPRASAMSSSPLSATPVCLVIRWPRSVAASSGPAQLLRRLVEDHLPATWGVETIEQAETLDAAIHLVEAALLIPKIKTGKKKNSKKQNQPDRLLRLLGKYVRLAQKTSNRTS